MTVQAVWVVECDTCHDRADFEAKSKAQAVALADDYGWDSLPRSRWTCPPCIDLSDALHGRRR